MGIRTVEHLTLYANPDRFCGNPNIARLDNGELLLGFRWAEGRLGADWDPTLRPVQMRGRSPRELARAEPRVIWDEDCGLTPYTCQLSDGSLLCVFNRWRLVSSEEAERLGGRARVREGYDLTGVPAPITMLRSTDRARTWEHLGELWLPRYGPGAGFRGNMVELPGGRLLFSLYVQVRPPSRAATSLLVASDDAGETWEAVATIADDADGRVGFNETFLHRTGEGTLVAFLRTSDAEGHLFTARSRDDGATWSEPTDEGVYGFPHHALQLPDGRVLLTYGRRQAPYGTRARLLDPECRNIAEADEVIIRGDGANGATGYPSAVELEEDLVLVVYYHNTGGELPWIGGTVLEIS